MEHINVDPDDYRVPEGAFWHSNMDLYYGYQPGEVVEVQHEPNKYWLATIRYAFRRLLLLRWVGNYGEFWIETSNQSCIFNPNGAFNDLQSKKRIYPLGYHVQSQMKSQFKLERPLSALIKPTLYNPTKDPYADIKTIDDLLSHEVNEQETDTFGEQTIVNRDEQASLVLAKCKTKIPYGQEDVDELEAALQNLNELETSDCSLLGKTLSEITTPNVTRDIAKDETNGLDEKSAIESDLKTKDPQEDSAKELPPSEELDSTEQDQIYFEMCKALQDSAVGKGRYIGIEEDDKKVYYLKPKQFFDVGGANHEKVLVPGTLLEVCFVEDGESGLELFHWIAIIIKNIGGRLELRWFICDEPKFKQGRLEAKSMCSDLVKREDDAGQQEEASMETESKEDKVPIVSKSVITEDDITFNMHYCNPCIHNIGEGKQRSRSYKMPLKLFSAIERTKNERSEALRIQDLQLGQVFDMRRMNLDKDRPIIEHLLSTIRWMRPTYINLTFSPLDTESSRKVLFSTPKTTKLFFGCVKRELEAGVFEIHSETIDTCGQIIKFVFPYDSSYCVLPLSWAKNNEDCLSINASRNQSPSVDTTVTESNLNEMQDVANHTEKSNAEAKNHSPLQSSQFKLLCEISEANYSLGSSQHTSFLESKSTTEFDGLDPSSWSLKIRDWKLKQPQFNCSIDYTFQELFKSQFAVMSLLEVVHPVTDSTICLGRIRKIVYPLIWIQISLDAFIVLPFNSTDIYPMWWCATYKYPVISLLPPRKRQSDITLSERKRKRAKNENGQFDRDNSDNPDSDEIEKELLDLSTLGDKQMDLDFILNEKNNYIRIYFNHKCFTGPSLSKGKICSLPQYVGPGPMRLVMEEVVTKVISVAYVPPRILNDLSSKFFEDLLITRGLNNLAPMEFKAKYQKRVHRELIPVCVNPDDVAAYCECVCEHLKCCYNLFGPSLYDGDDCPGHCRALTKSNKFMKRATYYREKARLGEFLNDNGGSKKSNSNSTNANNKGSRARYAGRGSSESTSSSISRSEQVQSRASSQTDETPALDLKENLARKPIERSPIYEEENPLEQTTAEENETVLQMNVTFEDEVKKPQGDQLDKESVEASYEKDQDLLIREVKGNQRVETSQLTDSSEPEDWTVQDVADYLDAYQLGKFKPLFVSEVCSRNITSRSVQTLSCSEQRH